MISNRLRNKEVNWVERGSFSKYGCDRIFKIQEGNGDNLLILQGISTSSINWNSILDILNQKFRILLPDFLGLGFSDKPKRYSYSIEDSFSQIIYLLKKYRIKSFHILAYDFGIDITSKLIKKISEEPEGLKVLSVSLIYDKSFELPKPYFWNQKHPLWVSIPLNFRKHIRQLNIRGEEDWKTLNKDLIPIGLTHFNNRSETSQTISGLNQSNVPVCVFLQRISSTHKIQNLKELKRKFKKVRIIEIPEFTEILNMEENALFFTEEYFKFQGINLKN